MFLFRFHGRNPNRRGNQLGRHVAIFESQDPARFQIVEPERIIAAAGTHVGGRGGRRIQHRGYALGNHVLHRAHGGQGAGTIRLIFHIRLARHQRPAADAVESIGAEKTPRNQLGHLSLAQGNRGGIIDFAILAFAETDANGQSRRRRGASRPRRDILRQKIAQHRERGAGSNQSELSHATASADA